jgi:serine-type D-Ala-D-Ala carboxypeptidase (penicillin-binding protein 5/6)
MNSPLQGGRRRRRAGGRLALLLGVLAPVAVAGAVYAGVVHKSDGHTAAPVVAVGGPSGGGALSSRRPVPPLKRLAVPTVRLSGVDAFRLHFHHPPRAALLFDMDSGEVLWRRRPLTRLPIASLTKIMTALVVVDHTRPHERMPVPRAALRYSGSGLGVLRPGRPVRVEALLEGLLLVSGNDAAIALAAHVAGSERRFVRLMNRRARLYGLGCTRFVSSHGLQSKNRSCAADLAVLARLAMARHRIARIARLRQAAPKFPLKGGRVYLPSHNPLMRLGYRGWLGLKTGYTRPAGSCFVGVARRHGRTLGVVLLGSPDPGKQAAKLLNAGFRSA